MAELAAAYGTPLDPWQADALEAGLGVRADGQWAAPTVGVNIARQNGKSVVLVTRALAGALLFGERTIICSAHEQKTSRVLFRNLESYFSSFTDLRRRVLSVGSALGREEIRLKDGTHIFFPARTRSTLRGWSIDLYLADEAQLLTDSQWESAKPAMAARPNSSVWLFGTAPQFVTDAEVFGRLRQSAHAGADDLAWVEYGADPGADLDDPEQWAAANPGRVTPEAIEAERRELSPGGFARERMNLWPTDRTERIIDLDHWNGLTADGPPDGTAPTALAVDAGPDRTIAIAAAWRLDDDRIHVELVAADYCDDPLQSLQFVLDRAARKRIPVIIDGASPAASMIPALTMGKVKVVVTTARDVGQACGGFLDDVRAGRITHANQTQLTAAVDGARKRPIGDAGLFGWDRRDGAVFVAPLVAATLARYGAATIRKRSGGAVFT